MGSLISQDQSCLKTIPGKNSVLISDSSVKMSLFLYKISKKRSGNIFTQCLNTNRVSFFFSFSNLSKSNWTEDRFHHFEISPEYSGKLVVILDIKLLKDIYLNQTNLNI